MAAEPITRMQRLKGHKPTIILGAMVILSHIGWKRLQGLEGVGEGEQTPYPFVRLIRRMTGTADAQPQQD